VLEDIDDLAIDNAQCLEQAKVYGGVFNGLMDTSEYILNNRMSTLMKQLTVLNVVFLPLNLIAGIGGMSEFTAMVRFIRVPAWASYILLVTAMGCIGFLTYAILRLVERRASNSQ
jgi:magnesium transporter